MGHAQNDKASNSTNIHLICTGSGSAAETETTYMNERTKTDTGKEKSFGTVQQNVTKSFNGTAYIDIIPPFARIRPPNAMVPTLSSGDEGWFEIKKLEITETEITGVIRFNILNKPKIRIDRLSGNVEISGPYSEFSGQAKAYDPEKAEKLF